MTRTPDQAIKVVSGMSASGTRFGAGLCKRKTREAYAVPSDGSNDATEAWGRVDHRLNVPGDKAPRGALLWWTGGSEGHGHVAIADGKGGVWSVDVKRTGCWDHVPFAGIASWAPRLKWAGVSRDIDGVTVVPLPVAERPPAPAPPKVPIEFQRVLNRMNNDHTLDLDELSALQRTGIQPYADRANVLHDKVQKDFHTFATGEK